MENRLTGLAAQQAHSTFIIPFFWAYEKGFLPYYMAFALKNGQKRDKIRARSKKAPHYAALVKMGLVGGILFEHDIVVLALGDGTGLGLAGVLLPGLHGIAIRSSKHIARAGGVAQRA